VLSFFVATQLMLLSWANILFFIGNSLSTAAKDFSYETSFQNIVLDILNGRT